MDKLHLHERTCTACSEHVRKCVRWCSQHLFNIHICTCMVLATPVELYAYSPEKMHLHCLCNGVVASLTLEAVANLSWVLREHSTGYRLPHASLLSRRNQSLEAVRSKHPSKSTLAQSHDAVAAAVSHKHHLIICVGAGLIQFVYGSHSKRDHGAPWSRFECDP